jgi:hypothetical protein
MLISLVLNNSPKETIADKSVELCTLPLTPQQEEWFEEYLLRGEGAGIKKAKDTVMFRRVGTGRFKEALALKGLSPKPQNGLDWKSLSNAVQDGMGPRMDL